MDTIYKLSFIALICAALYSCGKSHVTPTVIPRADTSSTLIGDTRLVGNWAIVTDSVFYDNNKIVYHGVAGDHYKFTKYGNLYISEQNGNFIDTAIYAVTTVQVGWINTYMESNGLISTAHTTTPPLNIVRLDTANLILSQTVQASAGQHFEQITFKKIK
ncbi:hypothetical protein [Mucilaginibacter sp. BT774]|uniref:hypothetical protein n=1 Tax=Mucilaginibacter sp. BT774 TaxID=3062276 RepID=UPI0026770179|nr:hypothetical protein [Mucilaginibacter sp. BT774]MDO3627874.1 hypothetical protein [Mucilaginibacter sp. BT774]